MSPRRLMDPALAAIRWDAVVVGGGFYGCSIAAALKNEYGLANVLLVEREDELLKRASLCNQARVHNGYHYPRSFTTAFRSRVNFSRFVEAYGDCVVSDFKALYCIAANNSKVTRHQFERFCNQIGASFAPADTELQALFNRDLIDAVYEVTEYAFDARALASMVSRDMAAEGVELLLGATVDNVTPARDGLSVSLHQGGDRTELRCGQVFNCTYAGLNFIAQEAPSARAPLKYEIAEIALITPPEPLAGLGVTVMDGPFFSCMPFPAQGCHSLTHVRYTPHSAWQDARDGAVHPYDVLRRSPPRSQSRHMLADAARYLPILREARYEDSLFEIKAILAANEVDDGRPILFQRCAELPGMYLILGGKIDNIFDVKEAMRSELGATAGAELKRVRGG